MITNPRQKLVWRSTFVQPTSRTCWLAALQCAIHESTRRQVTEQRLRQILRDLRFPIRNYGVFNTYMALLLVEVGIRPVVYVSRATLSEFFRNPPRTSLELVRRAHRGRRADLWAKDASLYLRALTTLSLNRVPVRVIASKEPAGRRLLPRYLNNGSVVISRVDCEDFYGIAGDHSGHSVVLYRTAHTLQVLDPYRSLGPSEYPEWRRHARFVRRFDWTRWSDDFIVIPRDIEGRRS